jgi:hypothetical protein
MTKTIFCDEADRYTLCLYCGNIVKGPRIRCFCSPIIYAMHEQIFGVKPNTIYIYENLKNISREIKTHLDNNIQWHIKKVFFFNRASKKQVKEFIMSQLV